MVTARAPGKAAGRLSVVSGGLSGWPVAGGVVSGDGRPSVARLYDCLLGGSYNFAVDRRLAEQVIAAAPQMRRVARAYRHFLFRAVCYCLGAGVRQFVDIGCGVPSVGGVYEVARRADPHARVACVDVDPVAVALTASVLAGDAGAGVFGEDLRRPEAILAHPDLHRVLDLRRPVAVVLGGVLQFLADAEDPAGVVGRLLAPLAAGSHLVISHATTEGGHLDWGPVGRLYQQAGVPLTARSRAQIEDLFGGLALVDPGVVWLPVWRPEPGHLVEADARWSGGLAGVARKPQRRVVTPSAHGTPEPQRRSPAGGYRTAST
jgi:hypothetical protein